MPADETRPLSPRGLVLAAAVALVFAVVWIATLPAGHSYGWDESMHVALPAARMRVALAEGQIGAAFDALLGCAQYPFAQPVLLAGVQSLLGATERVARALGIVEWCATLLGLFVLTRLVLDSIEPARRPRAAALAPWLAFALAALSPLALNFAGTLFLEIPAACASVWALVAWLGLWSAPSGGRALLAGGLATLALFTKWNYGLLLGAGLALDLLWRLGERDGRAERLRVLVPLAVVPVLACLWWFVLPLPGGSAVAAEHRSALASYLAGNQEFARVETSRRAFYATCLLSITPRMALVVTAGVFLALTRWKAPAVRTLIFVLVATWAPVWTHPFFQERFLLPGAVSLVAIAAIGLGAALPSAARGVAVALSVLFLAWLPLRGAEGIPFDTRLVADACGVLPRADPGRTYAAGEIERRRRLLGGRWLDSAGPETGVAAALLDAVAREVGPDGRFGWIGVSTEMSPGALHLGLLERGGSRERFLRDATATIDLDYFADPKADAAAVKAFAERFDVVFATEPPDLKARKDRVWARGAREALLAEGTWTAREIGRFEIARPLGDPLVVTLFACRRRT